MNVYIFEFIKLLVILLIGFSIGMFRDFKRDYAAQFEAVSKWAKVAVLWVQQIFWTEDGAVRKREALSFLRELCKKYKWNITDEQLEALVEAAVKQMNYEMGVGYIEVNDGNEGTTD